MKIGLISFQQIRQYIPGRNPSISCMSSLSCLIPAHKVLFNFTYFHINTVRQKAIIETPMLNNGLQKSYNVEKHDNFHFS